MKALRSFSAMWASRWVRPITAWKGILVSYGAGCYVEYWTELIWWNITNESSEVEKVWRSDERRGVSQKHKLPPDSQCYISVAAAIRLKSAPLSWLLRGFFQNMERKQGKWERGERGKRRTKNDEVMVKGIYPFAWINPLFLILSFLGPADGKDFTK